MGTIEDIEARLRVVEDTLACWQLRIDWEHTVDTVQSAELPDPSGKDPVEDAFNHLMSLFTEDAVLGVGSGTTVGDYSGKEAIRNYFKNVRLGGPPNRLVHNVVQPRIEVKGDSATAKWLVTVYFPDGSGAFPPVRALVECNDEYQRSGNEWKIKRIEASPFYFVNFAGTPWGGRPTGLPSR